MCKDKLVKVILNVLFMVVVMAVAISVGANAWMTAFCLIIPVLVTIDTVLDDNTVIEEDQD